MQMGAVASAFKSFGQLPLERATMIVPGWMEPDRVINDSGNKDTGEVKENEMTTKTEHTVTQLQQQNLAVAMKLAQLSIESAQKLLRLQVEATRDIFDEGIVNAGLVVEADSPQEMIDLRARYARQAAEKMFTCSRTMASLTAEMQANMAKMVSERLSHNGQEFIDVMEELLQGAPLNSHTAAEVLQHAFESARKSLEQVSKASSEAFSTLAQFTERKH
jgi:phasin family protein